MPVPVGVLAYPLDVLPPTGGIITTPGDGYTYHTFLTDGVFDPRGGSISAQCLVVAGGGGGGNVAGGGGGAGGLLALTLTVSASQSITIGLGGTGGFGNAGTIGTNGGNTTFGTLATAIGGGHGAGSGSAAAGGNGGSGGGGSFNTATTATPGTGTSGQGNSGGASVVSGVSGAGGGGGAGTAGAAGTAGTGNAAGNGGNGYIWLDGKAYAGGGGGGRYTTGGGTPGLGGFGGGGDGGTRDSTWIAKNGTANTGGGGGGGGHNDGSGGVSTGGNGGSGIVIVRYLSGLNVITDMGWSHLHFTEGPAFRLLGLLTGASVTTWPDEIAANAAPLTAGSGTFRAADTSINNRSCVENTGAAVDGKMHAAAVAAAAQVAAPFTIIWIGQLDVAGAGHYVFDGANDGNSGLRIIFQSSPFSSSAWGLNAGGAATAGAVSTGIKAVRIKIAAGAASVLTVNGTTVMNNVNVGSNTWQGITLGGVAGAPMDGRNALWGITPGDLTTHPKWADLQALVLGYYGVALS